MLLLSRVLNIDNRLDVVLDVVHCMVWVRNDVSRV